MEFLDEKRIKNVDELKIKVDLKHYKTKRGVRDELTELRYNIFHLINVPPKPSDIKDKKYLAKWKPMKFSVVCGLTRGFTKQELYSIYRESISFTKNPQALFWKLYKEFKQKYGEKIKERINKKRLSEMGKKGRCNQQEERNQVLF